MTRTRPATAATSKGPATPQAFLKELNRLFVKQGAAAAAAYYDRCGRAMAEGLTGRDLLTLEEIMHIVDTVIDWRPPADASRPRAQAGGPAEPAHAGAEAPAGARQSSGVPGAGVPQ